MCLIFISLDHHPAYKLILVANRDEFYQRKTSAANYWSDHPDVLGGRDLEAMGTWMGVNKKGKLSLITNYRDLRHLKAKAPSRGELVSDYLIRSPDPETYLKSIATTGSDYNGFNLLVGNPDELFYYSNYRDGITQLTKGFYGLSNHLLETPWPKVVRGKKLISDILSKKEFNAEALLDVMQDDVRAPLADLPDTGIGEERELALSSMFIKTPGYGTRCSTVVLIDRANNMTFVERVYNTTDFTSSTQTFQFAV